MNTKLAIILAALVGPPAFAVTIHTTTFEDAFVMDLTAGLRISGGTVTITNVPIDGTVFPLVAPRAISLQQTAPPNPVPESGATAALLGLGVVSSALLRRKLD